MRKSLKTVFCFQSYILIVLFRYTPLGYIRRTCSNSQVAIMTKYGHNWHFWPNAHQIMCKNIQASGISLKRAFKIWPCSANQSIVMRSQQILLPILSFFMKPHIVIKANKGKVRKKERDYFEWVGVCKKCLFQFFLSFSLCGYEYLGAFCESLFFLLGGRYVSAPNCFFAITWQPRGINIARGTTDPGY